MSSNPLSFPKAGDFSYLSNLFLMYIKTNYQCTQMQLSTYPKISSHLPPHPTGTPPPRRTGIKILRRKLSFQYPPYAILAIPLFMVVRERKGVCRKNTPSICSKRMVRLPQTYRLFASNTPSVLQKHPFRSLTTMNRGIAAFA